jgi:hypothetical protein
MAQHTVSIISWFLLAGGLPEHSSLSTDIHPSLNCLNHSLSCAQSHFWIWVPKFLAKLDANVLLNFLGHHQCNTHDTHNNRFWLIGSN